MFFLSRLKVRVGLVGLLAIPVVATVLLAFSNSTPADAACSALPSNNGTAAFTMTAPSTGTYRFWAHIYSPSAGNNAVYARVDSTYCQITVGNSSSMPVGQFTWVDYQNGTTSSKINMALSSGNHSVTLAGLDPGVGVDKVLLLADTNCVPTGDGSNCIAVATPTPTATPMGTPTPTPKPTVVVTPAPGASPPPSGGGTPVSGTITLPKATQPDTTVSYLVDGKPVSGNSVDTTQLTNGTHTLEVVKKNADGTTQVTAQKLFVDNVKHWWTGVLDWVRHPVNAAIAGVAVLLLLGGGVVLWRKLRPEARMPNSHDPAALGAPATSPADAPLLSVATPPDPLAGVFQPDSPSDPNSKI